MDVVKVQVFSIVRWGYPTTSVLGGGVNGVNDLNLLSWEAQQAPSPKG